MALCFENDKVGGFWNSSGSPRGRLGRFPSHNKRGRRKDDGERRMEGGGRRKEEGGEKGCPSLHGEMGRG